MEDKQDMQAKADRVAAALKVWDAKHPNVPYAGASTHRTLPFGAKALRGFGPKSMFTVCQLVNAGLVVVDGVQATVEKYLDASETRRSRIRIRPVGAETSVVEVTSAPTKTRTTRTTRTRRAAPTAVRATPKVAPPEDGILDLLIERVTEAVIKRLISALT